MLCESVRQGAHIEQGYCAHNLTQTGLAKLCRLTTRLIDLTRDHYKENIFVVPIRLRVIILAWTDIGMKRTLKKIFDMMHSSLRHGSV